MKRRTKNQPAPRPEQFTIDTKEGWCEWVQQPERTRPFADLPDLQAYKALDPGARWLVDRQRFRAIAELVMVPTPPVEALHRIIQRKMLINHGRMPIAGRGVVVTGPPGAGKTTAALIFGKRFHRQLARDEPDLFQQETVDFQPVVIVAMTDRATPKDIAKAIARFLNVPFKESQSKEEITSRVLRELARCGTRLIIFDDIHFLDLSAKEGRVANDYLKSLANRCGATFVYTGVGLDTNPLFSEGSGTERDTQTSGRFTLYELAFLGVSTTAEKKEWVKVIKTLEAALPLYRHEAGTLAMEWRYLHLRTDGSMNALSSLVREAAVEAILDGSEAIYLDGFTGLQTDHGTQRKVDGVSAKGTQRPRRSA